MYIKAKIYPSKRKIFFRFMQVVAFVLVIGFFFIHGKAMATTTFASFQRLLGVESAIDDGPSRVASRNSGSSAAASPSTGSASSGSTPTSTHRLNADAQAEQAGEVAQGDSGPGAVTGSDAGGDPNADNLPPRPPEPSDLSANDPNAELPPEGGTLEGM
jgi:hypothetical protein